MHRRLAVALLAAITGAVAGCSRPSAGPSAGVVASPSPSPPPSPAGPAYIATTAPQPLSRYPDGAADAHVYFWCSPGESGFCDGSGVELVLRSDLRLEPRRPIETWKDFRGFVIARGRLVVTGPGRRRLEATHARFVSEGTDYVDTTVDRIEQDPARWQGVPVHLEAGWAKGFEVNSLGGAWVLASHEMKGFPPFPWTRPATSRSRSVTVPVEVWAIADTSRRAYGHLGSSKVGLTIGRAVYRGTKVAESDPKPDASNPHVSYLSVVSKQWAQVWVDGRMIDQETPAPRVEVAPGIRDVRLVNPTRKIEIRRPVKMVAGRDTLVKADLLAGTFEVSHW